MNDRLRQLVAFRIIACGFHGKFSFRSRVRFASPPFLASVCSISLCEYPIVPASRFLRRNLGNGAAPENLGPPSPSFPCVLRLGRPDVSFLDSFSFIHTLSLRFLAARSVARRVASHVRHPAFSPLLFFLSFLSQWSAGCQFRVGDAWNAILGTSARA